LSGIIYYYYFNLRLLLFNTTTILYYTRDVKNRVIKLLGGDLKTSAISITLSSVSTRVFD